MNQELILILKQIANSIDDIKFALCVGDVRNQYKCSGVYCENCTLYTNTIEYQPYAIDLGEPNE